jgi:YVTN family beta-propeller protein
MNYGTTGTVVAGEVETICVTNQSILFALKIGNGRSDEQHSRKAQYTGAAVTPSGKVYATNLRTNAVFVMDSTNLDQDVAMIAVGQSPRGVAINPKQNRAYITHQGNYHMLSVINTETDQVIDTIDVGQPATGVAVTLDGRTVYVTHPENNLVSVIELATNSVVKTISLDSPTGIAVNPDPKRNEAYVTNHNCHTVSIIDTRAPHNSKVISTLNVGQFPEGVAVTSDGKQMYVANAGDNSVSVISLGAWLRGWSGWRLASFVNGNTVIQDIGSQFQQNLRNGPCEVVRRVGLCIK